ADPAPQARREVAVLAAAGAGLVEEGAVALDAALALDVEKVDRVEDEAEADAGDLLARAAVVDDAGPERCRVPPEAARGGRDDVAPVDSGRRVGVARVEERRVAAGLHVDVDVDVDLMLLRVGLALRARERGDQEQGEGQDAAHAAQSTSRFDAAHLA